jgi:hypothetical protein
MTVKFLRIIDPASGPDEEYPLERDRITIGSSVENAVVLDGAEPFHAEILRHGDGFKLRDLDTDAGTQINGEWVMQQVLVHGDRIVIGPFEIVFCDPAAEEEAAPTGAPDLSPAAKLDDEDDLVTVGEARLPGPNGAAPVAPRRKRRAPGLGPVLGVFCIIAAAVIAYYFFDKFKTADRDVSALSQYVSTLDRLEDLKNRGHYQAARELLQVMASDDDPDVADRLREEREDLDRLEELDAQARARLDELIASVGGDSVENLEMSLGLFEATYSELAHLAPEIRDIRDFIARARAVDETGPVEVNAEEIEKRTRLLTEEGDYSTALKLWERFLPRDAETQALKRSEILRVKSKSRQEAQRLIARAAALSSEVKYKEIVELLGPTELARFKGTPLHGELAKRAAEAEDLAIKRPRRPPVGPGSETAEAGSRAQKPANRTPVSDHGRQPATGVEPPGETFLPAIPESEFKEVDEAIRGWQYDKAVSILQRLMDEARTREERNNVSTRIEFAYRQMWFLEDLDLYLTDSPEMARKVTVKARDGFKGKFHSMVNSHVNVESKEDIKGFLFEAIEPRSILNLARAYPLTLEDKLNVACFCLNNNLKAEFETMAAAVREEGTYKRSIDSFLAMDRGARVAVDFGYHLHDGRLVPHHEWREAVLNREIEALRKKVLSRDAAVRNEGYRGFLELGPVSFGALEETLRGRYTEKTQSLAAFPETARLEKLADVKRKLNGARDFALELIFDTVRYFYPYGHRQGEYSKVQREVDERVAKVREIWGNEFNEEIPGPKVKLSSKFLTVRDDLNQMALILKDITDGGFKRTSELGFANLLPTRGQTVHVRNFALDEEEWEIIDSSAAILEYNEKIETSATRNEWEQVLITNQYRLMMGRKALAQNELILQAARSHSEWMTRTGVFSHFEDTDERRTPGDRMAQAGYDKGSGENIHAGAGSPMGAHNGWYHSSGHHRNMLAPSHTEMATGHVGRYWTQNFGGGTEFSENLISE